jgi:hypothetical protein
VPFVDPFLIFQTLKRHSIFAPLNSRGIQKRWISKSVEKSDTGQTGPLSFICATHRWCVWPAANAGAAAAELAKAHPTEEWHLSPRIEIHQKFLASEFWAGFKPKPLLFIAQRPEDAGLAQHYLADKAWWTHSTDLFDILQCGRA